MMQLRPVKLAVVAAVLLAAATAAYWYWSPVMAVRAMRTAAIARDEETINDHVDYPRVRESVKGQLIAGMAGGADDRDGHPVAAFGASLGAMMAGTLVETAVRPGMVMAAIRKGEVNWVPSIHDLLPPTEGSDARRQEEAAAPEWRIERRGLDRVIARPEGAGAAGEQPMALVLERSGFATWKVVELRLPAAATRP